MSTSNFMDGMARIFLDTFAPFDDQTGDAALFVFRDPAGAAEFGVPAIFSEHHVDKAVTDKPHAPTVSQVWKTVTVSLEDYPALNAVRKPWLVDHPDGRTFEVVTHSDDLLLNRMRRFKLRKAD